MHVQVPGDWTVDKGHDLVTQIESDLRVEFSDAAIFTHIEPLNTSLTHDQSILSEIEE